MKDETESLLLLEKHGRNRREYNDLKSGYLICGTVAFSTVEQQGAQEESGHIYQQKMVGRAGTISDQDGTLLLFGQPEGFLPSLSSLLVFSKRGTSPCYLSRKARPTENLI